MTEEIEDLFAYRRQEKDPIARRELSKKIIRETRKVIRRWKDDSMNRILEEFKQLDRLNICGIKREVKEDDNKPSDDKFCRALSDIYASTHII